MSDLITDTHAAIWYFSMSPEMSALARQTINNAVGSGNVIILPTISIVEIVYLIEKNRLLPQTLARLMQELSLSNSSFVTQDLTAGIARALQQIPRSIVPDMPDRIVSATSLHLNLPLITKDGSIRKLTNIQTIW
ncbi:MAG: type II toxin-antitoxin system VapC family toxin [Pyrinomonadaceae bacterium]|nr:type II toxin-antitoxin system VapC family toxin [Pyrinomonadaceae bacterium]